MLKLLTLGVSLLVAGTAAAQSPASRAFVADARDATVGSSRPLAGWSLIDGHDRTALSVTLYQLADPTLPSSAGSRTWTARRLVRSQGAVSESWTDEQRCPALRRALADFVRLPLPPLGLVGYGRFDERPVLLADAPYYQLWSDHGQQVGRRRVKMTVEVDGGLLGDWIDTTMTALNDCWTRARTGASG